MAIPNIVFFKYLIISVSKKIKSSGPNIWIQFDMHEGEEIPEISTINLTGNLILTGKTQGDGNLFAPVQMTV